MFSSPFVPSFFLLSPTNLGCHLPIWSHISFSEVLRTSDVIFPFGPTSLSLRYYEPRMSSSHSVPHLFLSGTTNLGCHLPICSHILFSQVLPTSVFIFPF